VEILPDVILFIPPEVDRPISVKYQVRPVLSNTVTLPSAKRSRQDSRPSVNLSPALTARFQCC